MRNADTKNINRGCWRVDGLVQTNFMLTFVVVANLRLVRDRAKREGVFTDALHERPTEDFGFEELSPDVDVSLAPATFDLSPPEQATPTLTKGPRGASHVSGLLHVDAMTLCTHGKHRHHRWGARLTKNLRN